MTLRDVLSKVPVLRRFLHATELETTEPHHRQTLQKADRVTAKIIAAHRDEDAFLLLHARK